MLNQIMLGIGGMVFGFLVTYYTHDIIRIFGIMGPVEARMGPGRSYLALRMIGVAFIIFFFLYLMGWADDFIRGLFSFFG